MKQKIITILLAIVAILGGVNYAVSPKLGSISDGGAYNSTTTPTIGANVRMIKTGQGILGSVVIGVTSATTFELRNATSTTDIASTTIVSIAASPAIGSTMTVDASFDRGLGIVFPDSFTGRYTITYK